MNSTFTNAAGCMLMTVSMTACKYHGITDPIIDTPTPEQRRVSSYYHSLYPNGKGGQTDGGLIYIPQSVVTGQPEVNADGGTPSFKAYKRNQIKNAMRNGWEYCRNIEQHAARTSNQWTAGGLVFLGAGLAGSAAGTKMMAEGTTTLEDFVVLGGSLISVGIGIYGLQRSSSAAKASSAASLGLASNDSDAAFTLCMAARSQWVSERQGANTQAQLKMLEYAERTFSSLGKNNTPLDGGSTPDGGSPGKASPDGGSCSDGGVCPDPG